VTMHRFPDGLSGENFFQKEVPDYFPDWIERVIVKKEGGEIEHLLCQNAATLVYMADQACLTPHIWLSRIDRQDKPDRLIFDLDPPDDSFESASRAAKYLKVILEDADLVPFLMTTGSRGLHVVIPLNRSEDFDTVRDYARKIAETLSERHPDHFTTEQRTDKRGNRVFLDYLRNAYAQTAVTPYAIRAKSGAPVATPVDWDELDHRSLHSRSYTIKNIFRRLGQKNDPWKNINRRARSLKDL
jgi:bifunctional non-homologous end joining protein LigD